MHARPVLDQVEHWRAKADELRTVAEALHNEVARDELEEMADGYDWLADNMEDYEVKVRGGR
ncbi:MAG: hypothetical protein ACRD3W_27745 [Terriglobales bacterium]